MYMPLNVRLDRVVLFGAERGEGLAKLGKIARFASAVVAVPESLPIPAQVAASVPANVAFRDRPASETDLSEAIEGADFVVSDLSSRSLNERIAALCHDRGILVNIIDQKDLCDVYLMAIVDRPNVVLAVSTRGRCAFLAKELRKELEEWAADRDALAAVTVAARDALEPGLSKRERIERLQRVYYDPEVRRRVREGRPGEAEARARALAGDVRSAEGPVPLPARVRSVRELVDETASAAPRVAALDLERAMRGDAPPRLVDVREPDEFGAGTIPGAVNVPRGVLEMWATEDPRRAEDPLVLISNRGLRSRLAVASLIALGYDRVASLLGGIDAWREEGHRLTDNGGDRA
jgi:siroheme synthase-like protein